MTQPRAPVIEKQADPSTERFRANHEARLADVERALVKSPAGQGAYLGRQLLTGNGTYTPTAGTRVVSVRMAGGGGGGGGVGGSAGAGVGGGGNSGWCVEFEVVAVGKIAGGAYSCGAPGAGGTTAGSTGSTGGDTTIVIGGQTYTAKGGTGGSGNARTASNTVGGPTSPAAQPSAVGAVTYDVVTYGIGGLGFSSAGVVFWAGAGASSSLGAGPVALAGNNNGIAGSPGGGGGGGGSGASANVSGGAGGAGVIIVDEWS